MRQLVVVVLCIFSLSPLFASDIPTVPSQMEFAGMKLKITESARKEIQKHVNSLRASEKYFKIKLDRVNLYFPIIEKVFRDSNLPDDFKYLAIQESALISDAVSSANAVGFWQFKSFTGREVGLRIDNQVDERLNIVSASRGAAKYMKTNNFYYNNWIYALTAYNTGRGGARKFVDEANYGEKKMTIDKKTHWYVKTFLAHKIAFENEIGGTHSEGLKLVEYNKGGGKSLVKIAKEFDLDPQVLKEYNKWLKKGNVPTDKVYTVVIPVQGKLPKKTRDLIAKGNTKKTATSEEASPETNIPADGTSQYPTVIKEGLENAREIYVKVNGIDAILARGDDSPSSLAAKGSIPLHKFMRYNDLQENQEIYAGKIYYLRGKKPKSKIGFHITQQGESLWSVSQTYGIKVKKLAKLNRMTVLDEIMTGHLLWLNKKRPANVPIQIIELSEEQTLSPLVYEEKKIEPQEDVLSDEVLDSLQRVDSLLVVNDPMVLSGTYDVHIVKKGETLYRISKIYQMEIDSLITINGIDPYNMTIKVGQLLKVKKLPIEEIVEDQTEPDKSIDSTQMEPEIVPSDSVKTVTPPADNTISERIHVVKQGETLYSISRKYSITVERLLTLNNLTLEDGLNIDQRLLVGHEKLFQDKPEIEEEKTTEEQPQPIKKPETHTVEVGDTLYSISRKYGITVEELIQLNNKTDANIDIGEVLKIKK